MKVKSAPRFVKLEEAKRTLALTDCKFSLVYYGHGIPSVRSVPSIMNGKPILDSVTRFRVHVRKYSRGPNSKGRALRSLIYESQHDADISSNHLLRKSICTDTECSYRQDTKHTWLQS